MKLLFKVQDSKGTTVQTERALVSFEKVHGAASMTPMGATSAFMSSYKAAAIWFTATVGAMLLATLSYRMNFLKKSTKKSTVKKTPKRRVKK